MKLKLLGVSGSLRNDSIGLHALSLILNAAAELGAETRLLDLRMANLPMYNPDAEPDEHVARVLADVTWAQAFVLASPDYHGTMSGAMKNFLDFHWSEFSGKLFGYLALRTKKALPPWKACVWPFGNVTGGVFPTASRSTAKMTWTPSETSKIPACNRASA